MQPNNQMPQNVVTPSNSTGTGNEYDFIANNNSSPAKLNPLGGKSTLIKIAVVTALLLIILVVFSVFKNLLGGKTNKAELIAVAQSQQQIINLSTSALEVSSLSVENRNFAITTKISVASDQNIILKNLKKRRIKVNDDLLNPKKNSQQAINIAIENKALTDSITTNTYNQKFKEIMADKFKVYQNSLLKAYGKTSTTGGKKILEDSSNSADLLQKMLDSSSS